MTLFKYPLALLVTLSLQINAQQQRQPHSNVVAQQIQKVENGLSPLVVTDNSNLMNIEAQMAKYNIPGLSIAVIHNYKVEWAKGYGTLENGSTKKVTNATVFQAASMSKFVNAVALMKLKAQSGIDLDADINTYLRDWKFSYNKSFGKTPITLRQILSHTAGLSVHGFRGYKNNKALPSITQILDGNRPANSRAVKQIMAPSKAYKYSGGGTTISQLLLMNVAGSSYEDYVAAHIFKPLKMTNSFYAIEFNKYSDAMAIAHLKNKKPIKNKYNIYPESAAAGLWTTPTDLAKLIVDVQLSLKNNSGTILSDTLSNTLITNPLDTYNSGLGVFIEKEKTELYVQHSGSNEGFRGQFYFSANHGNGVVIMVNGPNTKIFNEIRRSVANVYKWPGFRTFKTAKNTKLSKADLQKFTGTYSYKNRIITVSLKNETLIISEKRKWSSKMTYLENTSFIINDVKPNATIKFVSNTEGEVQNFIIEQGESATWLKIK